MISCEEFENRFPHDQSPEVLEHRKNCLYCKSFSAELAEQRATVLCLPAYYAPLGFEAKLFRRLDELEAKPVRERRLMPNALAFASGLAVAVAAGVIYTGSIRQDNPSNLAPMQTEIAGVTEIVPDSTNADSTISLQAPWSQYWNYESVSTQP